jgi:hypothetical protein
MIIDNITTLLGVMSSILVAAAWLHNSLGQLRTEVRVLQTQLQSYDHRIARLESEVISLQKDRL